MTLSDPAYAAFSPSVAAHEGQALVAWHAFLEGGARIVYSIVVAGVPAPPAEIADPLGPGKRPWVAPTPKGTSSPTKRPIPRRRST